MMIRFSEEFSLPVEEVFSYFRTPEDWTRLYGLAGEAKVLGDGWTAVPLESFPFPLVAKNTVVEPNEHVHWVFRGFWRGEGDVTFTRVGESVRVEGYEKISVRWLHFVSPLVEKLFLERSFLAIWEIGWRRLRKRSHSGSELRS